MLADALACLRPLNNSEGSSKLVMVNSVWNSQESLENESDGAKGEARKAWPQPSTSKAAVLAEKAGDSKQPESLSGGATAQHSAPKASTSR